MLMLTKVYGVQLTTECGTHITYYSLKKKKNPMTECVTLCTLNVYF